MTDGQRTVDLAAMALPLVVVGSLCLCYVVSPALYLGQVLEANARETQLVELATFGCAFASAALLGFWSVISWRRGLRSPALYLGVVASAALFFAGEEISWGQTWLGWETPERFREFSRETNVHNSDLPVRQAANLFVIAVFFATPIAWRLRKRLGLWPGQGWRVVVAEPPAVFTAAVAFVWRLFKPLYRLSVEGWETRPFYVDFVEQLNEQKELLVAVALLLYALYRGRALKREPDGPGPSTGRRVTAPGRAP